jgi:hypothetical protein
MSDHTREAFAEDALGAETVLAAEAPRAQFESDGCPVPGEVGDGAQVIAVDAGRGAAAARALGLRSGSSHDECQRAVVLDDLL